MQKTRMILIMLSIMLISSGCKFPWPKETVERCFISVQYNKCRCHEYKITKDFIGRVGESTDYPILYCDGAVAFRGGAWAVLRAWFEEILAFVKSKEDKKNAVASDSF